MAIESRVVINDRYGDKDVVYGCDGWTCLLSIGHN